MISSAGAPAPTWLTKSWPSTDSAMACEVACVQYALPQPMRWPSLGATVYARCYPPPSMPTLQYACDDPKVYGPLRSGARCV
jgi:hypothetical protein